MVELVKLLSHFGNSANLCDELSAASLYVSVCVCVCACVRVCVSMLTSVYLLNTEYIGKVKVESYTIFTSRSV